MLLPTDETLRTLFATARTIAIIGAKDVPGQPVDRIGRYLMEAGYTVIPVHPKRKTVWGLPAVPRIDLVEQADIVNVFRAPQYCPDHAREVLNMGHRPQCFWMQEGIASPEARKLLADAGLLVLQDRCIYVEHARLMKNGPQQA